MSGHFVVSWYQDKLVLLFQERHMVKKVLFIAANISDKYKINTSHNHWAVISMGC